MAFEVSDALKPGNSVFSAIDTSIHSLASSNENATCDTEARDSDLPEPGARLSVCC